MEKHLAKALYVPQEVSDFVYARHVVAAVEAADGQIFTGFCREIGFSFMCRKPSMYQQSGSN
ncbi:MAG: hypothetical protein V8T37_03360 [Streptococcus sp.]